MKNRRCVDIVICLDSTGKQFPIFDIVKKRIISLYPDMVKQMKENQEIPDQFRIKIISFKDYAFDDEPMVESEFFCLPEQTHEFCNYVDGIEACGGGDYPENILEAISLAISSDWNCKGERFSQLILVFSNSTPLQLGERKNNSKVPYPNNIPADIDELKQWWYGDEIKIGTFVPSSANLLVPMAVDCDIWREISSWDRCRVNII